MWRHPRDDTANVKLLINSDEVLAEDNHLLCTVISMLFKTALQLNKIMSYATLPCTLYYKIGKKCLIV